MSYESALVAAGATVHVMKEFGSYQGDWWAKVTFQNETGWVHGWYGSCSGSDAFLCEFDYGDERCEKHEYGPRDDACPDCKAAAATYQGRLAEFGRTYLDDLYTQDEALKEASKHIEWDSDAQPMVDFIKENAL